MTTLSKDSYPALSALAASYHQVDGDTHVFDCDIQNERLGEYLATITEFVTSRPMTFDEYYGMYISVAVHDRDPELWSSLADVVHIVGDSTPRPV